MTGPAPKIDNTINATARDQLRSVVSRLERLNEDADAVKADKREVMAEAKGNGWNTAIIAKIVRLRARDSAKAEEEDALIDLYRSAIGEGEL